VGFILIWSTFVAVVAYALGYFDGRWAKPPEPMRGTYESNDSDDRVDDYPDDWV
jgi:hypothetical protein